MNGPASFPRGATANPIHRLGSRPDFMVLAYPVISMTAPFSHKGSIEHLLSPSPDPKLAEGLSNERRVTAQTPPAFLFHTADDPGMPVEKSLVFAQALRQAGCPSSCSCSRRARRSRARSRRPRDLPPGKSST